MGSSSRCSSSKSSNNYLERRRRSSGLVDKLIKEVTKKPKDQINEGNIGDYITELSSLSSTNDNERQLQALLPLFSTVDDTNLDNNTTTSVSTDVVAQVINAIKLEILGGFISIWVLLRGDGVPLQLALATEKDSSSSNSSEDR